MELLHLTPFLEPYALGELGRRGILGIDFHFACFQDAQYESFELVYRIGGSILQLCERTDERFTVFFDRHSLENVVRLFKSSFKVEKLVNGLLVNEFHVLVLSLID